MKWTSSYTPSLGSPSSSCSNEPTSTGFGLFRKSSLPRRLRSAVVVMILTGASLPKLPTSSRRQLGGTACLDCSYRQPERLRLSKNGLSSDLATRLQRHSERLSATARENWTKTLLYTLIRSRGFKATDPRDKLYSLLGLVQDSIGDKPRLNPIYGDQALSKTYTDAAIQILEDSDDLLLLSCVEGEKFQLKTTEPLPSWVPDWSCEMPLGLRVTGYKRYSASGSITQRPKVDTSARTLTLKGINLDDVSVVGEAKHEVMNGQSFPKWLQILGSLPMYYREIQEDHGGEHRVDVFWRTLIVNTLGDPPRIAPKSLPLVQHSQNGLQTPRCPQGRIRVIPSGPIRCPE